VSTPHYPDFLTALDGQKEEKKGKFERQEQVPQRLGNDPNDNKNLLLVVSSGDFTQIFQN
jgi:hypothetical protein